MVFHCESAEILVDDVAFCLPLRRSGGDWPALVESPPPPGHGSCVPIRRTQYPRYGAVVQLLFQIRSVEKLAEAVAIDFLANHGESGGSIRSRVGSLSMQFLCSVGVPNDQVHRRVP